MVILLAAVIGGGNDKDDKKTGTPDSSEASTAEVQKTSTAEVQKVSADAAESDPAENTEYKLEHGDLVSAITNEIDGKNVLVIKAKISSSYNNSATVDQNYYNVEDLIQNQGCAEFDEIQYWAVADMSDGKESKVVSFTVGSELIKKIADKSIAANQLGDHVADLYILPSLAE